MKLQTFAETKCGHVFVRTMASIMECRLRYRFFGPMKILRAALIRPGQTVLEVGCGTGFFTLPAARMIGDRGCLIAMDTLPIAVDAVSKKVQTANLNNVRVVQGDALDTGLASESIDLTIIFGVIPAPMLPIDRFLTEMHRVLKPDGTMAVWPPSWVHKSIPRSGLFTISGKRDGVTNYRRR
jgi:ubiquinone/menaquinone biosynthesis C-methylase UbiE